MESEGEPVVFKKISRKNIRQRQPSSSDTTADNQEAGPTNDDPEVKERIEMAMELRKLRQRPHGVSAVTLALGKKVAKEEEVLLVTDPFKSVTGGMIDMDALRSGKFQPDDNPYDTGIGTQFSAETNTRDEDAEMLKYIEIQLNERKKASEKSEEVEETKKFLSPEEAALMALPEYLRKSGSNKNEEMLSNQMLSGIPEIDLGIEVKIKNIEATEEAKQKIVRERMSKKELPSQFVPTNMAVNFVQHNRFNIDEPQLLKNNPPKRKIEPEKPKKVVVVGADPEELDVTRNKDKGEKATDDFHFEKFKKQFRRF